MVEQDWRETAYLDKQNWPKAIPYIGPKREYGPYPWGKYSGHFDPHDLDDYGWTHPDAGSVGSMYAGDVCPYCGVPLRLDEPAVNNNGQKGELHEISPNEQPIPCYQPECWNDRQAERYQIESTTLSEYQQ